MIIIYDTVYNKNGSIDYIKYICKLEHIDNKEIKKIISYKTLYTEDNQYFIEQED